MTTVLSNVLGRILTQMPSEVQRELGQGTHLPNRYFAQAPLASETFILPMKQTAMKDSRLMPGTRCMLALLSGWMGTDKCLQLTQSTIAKHLGRSIRQVYNYLKDAARLGYLTYNYRKNRIGMITGIRVWLSLELLRPKKLPKNRRNQARQLNAETNENRFIYKKDKEIEEKLQSLAGAMGIKCDDG